MARGKWYRHAREKLLHLKCKKAGKKKQWKPLEQDWVEERRDTSEIFIAGQ